GGITAKLVAGITMTHDDLLRPGLGRGSALQFADDVQQNSRPKDPSDFAACRWRSNCHHLRSSTGLNEERPAVQGGELLPNPHPVHCTGCWPNGVKHSDPQVVYGGVGRGCYTWPFIAAGTGMPIVELSHVRKVYDTKVAVDDLSIAIEPGTMFGLLGPNGSGKTSSIRMMIGITAPDSGTVSLFGKPFSRKMLA